MMFGRGSGLSTSSLQPPNPSKHKAAQQSCSLQPSCTGVVDSHPGPAFLARLRRACSSSDGTTAGGCLNLSMLGLEALPDEALDLAKAAAVLGFEWWSLSDWAKVDISFNAIRELPGLKTSESQDPVVERVQHADVKYHELWPSLQFFIARENQLTSLPEAFCVLPSLKHLDLTGNALTTLPTNFSSLHALVELRVSNNKLRNLPIDLDVLPALAVIDCSHNSLVEIPPCLLSCACPALRSLVCSFNQIDQLRVTHCTCTASCQASVLSPSPPSSSCISCSRLEILECASNRLVSLPEGFGLAFARLRQLDLRNNYISQLPYLFPPVSIQRLILANNRITSFPAPPSSYPVSYSLSVSHDISGSKTESNLQGKPRTPDSAAYDSSASFLSRCADLNVLDLSSNRIAFLAEEDWQDLSSLATLDLRHNELADLPNALGFLPSLQRLYVSGNRIKKIRSSLINDLDDSQTVSANLSNNRVEDFPRANRTAAERIHQLKLYLRERAGGERYIGSFEGGRAQQSEEDKGRGGKKQTIPGGAPPRSSDGGRYAPQEELSSRTTTRRSTLPSCSSTVSSLPSPKDEDPRSDLGHPRLSTCTESEISRKDEGHGSLSCVRSGGQRHPGRAGPRRETCTEAGDETWVDTIERQRSGAKVGGLPTRGTRQAPKGNGTEEAPGRGDGNRQRGADISGRREVQRQVGCSHGSSEDLEKRTRVTSKAVDEGRYPPSNGQPAEPFPRPGRRENLVGKNSQGQVGKALTPSLPSACKHNEGQKTCYVSSQSDIQTRAVPASLDNKGGVAGAKVALQRKAVQLAKEIEEIDERIREDLSLGRVDLLQLRREKAKKMAARNRILMQQEEALN